MNNFTHLFVKKYRLGWGLVAHACNSSCSRSRDQEDHSSKPAWENSYLGKKKLLTKKWAGGVAQGVGPEFKLHIAK
jgi:hypothetical protein